MDPITTEFQCTVEDFAEANKAAGQQVRRRAFSPKAIVWISVFVFGFVATSFLRRDPTPPSPPVAAAPAHSNFWSEMVVPLIPWLLIFGFVWMFIFRLLRKRLRENPIIGRSFEVTISDLGICWSDPVSRTEYKRLAFRGFDETANLFILYLTDPIRVSLLQYHLIPKRSLRIPGQLTQVRTLLEANIRRT